MFTRRALVVGLISLFAVSTYAQDGGRYELVADDAIVVPRLINDPLEPINRATWSFNTVVINRLIHPVGKGYRFIVREPVREKVNNFTDNITYPKRLINNLLQGRFNGARQETHRFAVNSTLGVAGLFDPATSWEMPRSKADFGQTFGRWGWDPSMYFVIPILGPSSERDGIGLLLDTASNPVTWAPNPYNYALYGLSFNTISDNTGEFKRLTEAGTDSYAFARQASSLVRANDIDEFQITAAPAEPALSSLNAVFFTHRDAEFPERAKARSVRLSTTGQRLPYSLWLQPGHAPVVYVLPGLGGHRMERPSLAIAELLYEHGYSVVTISSVFNAEFMEAASTAAVPGYASIDNSDMHVAIDAIDLDLEAKYGDRTGKRALLGFSMGAFQTMLLAARHETETHHRIHFERYIAINPPVDLLHGMDALDSFYKIALNWPADERTARIEEAFRKVAFLIAAGAASAGNGKAAEAPPALPFDRTESGFLVGYAYRTILRDIIYSSQSRHNLGVIQEPIRKFRRAAVYEEIGHYNYSDYLNHFVVPYYENGGYRTADGQSAPVNSDDIVRSANLRNFTAGLRSVPDLRIIASDDDFLLRDGDLDWMRSLVPANHMKVMPNGGHMGHLGAEPGKRAVVDSLDGL